VRVFILANVVIAEMDKNILAKILHVHKFRQTTQVAYTLSYEYVTAIEVTVDLIARILDN
jgi:hypothetical protein